MSQSLPNDIVELLSPSDDPSQSNKLQRAIQRYTSILCKCLSAVADVPIISLPPPRSNRKKTIDEGLVGVEKNPGPKKPSRIVVKKTIDKTVSKLVKQPTKKTAKRSKGGNAKALSVVGKLYLKSLLNPDQFRSGIPDPCGFRTTIVQVTLERTLVVGTGLVTGLRVNLTAGASQVSIQEEDYSSSFDDNMVYKNPIYFSNSSLASTFVASRLVSASVTMDYQGTTQNDSGSYMGASYIGNPLVSETVATTGGGILAVRDSGRFSINHSPVCTVRWKPLDNSADEFTGVQSGDPRGVLQIHVIAAASQTFGTRIVCNYECIVRTDQTTFVETFPSPMDPTAFSTVRSMVTAYPSVIPVALYGLGLGGMAGVAARYFYD